MQPVWVVSFISILSILSILSPLAIVPPDCAMALPDNTTAINIATLDIIHFIGSPRTRFGSFDKRDRPDVSAIRTAVIQLSRAATPQTMTGPALPNGAPFG